MYMCMYMYNYENYENTITHILKHINILLNIYIFKKKINTLRIYKTQLAQLQLLKKTLNSI